MARNTGMTRAFDDLGRVCIPKEIRRSIGAEVGSYVQIFMEGEDIVLRKLPGSCACCGSTAYRMLRHGGVSICEDCFSKFEPECKEENR